MGDCGARVGVSDAIDVANGVPGLIRCGAMVVVLPRVAFVPQPGVR
ncbi:MAG: hypothetical protein ACREM1_00575 [Longimicrobiales bacterium]